MSDADPVQGSLEFPLEPGCQATVLDQLLEQARAAGMAACSAADLRLVVEEVLTNVVKYSGAAEAGQSGRVRWRMWPGRLDLEFSDPGVPFDPLQEDEEGLSDEERCEGGMGILLLRALADTIDYAREDGMNRLRLTFTGP